MGYFPHCSLVIAAAGLLLMTGVSVVEVGAACNSFSEIKEGNYDRNYSSITLDGARPLGFDKGDVPFNSEAKKSHCVTISNMRGRAVEVVYETVPSMKLCVRDSAGKGDCREGRYYDCYRATSDVMTFEFYCAVSQGCSESDVTFWYRLVRGPPASEDPEGMWCEWRDDEYPEALAPLPPIIIPPQHTPRPNPVGAAAGLPLPKFLILGCIAFFIAICDLSETE